MDILLTVFLPLSLAFIMFSLGLGLMVSDFARVIKLPKAFFIGAVSQVVLLPLVAFVLLMIFSLPGELALGVMILAFCPGGVTSNILTRLAGGALALSITLTAVVSLLSVATVPFLVAMSATYFMGTDAPDIDVTGLAISMFAITAIPVSLGVLLRHFAPGFVARAETPVSRVATALFVVIVIGALAANWDVFVENVVVLGPLLVLLNVILIVLGFSFARIAGLTVKETAAISIETGVQNSTLGITVGGLIAATATGLPVLALPAGVYGITMYIVTLPFVFWIRRKTAAA